ncbi:hypothetical protein DFQ27_009055 [Actinomortierella ambigua]|uniref:Sphingomyelin synthase-like domain-containing protein n=1 Tax=Actinomortierella ambigua TaxID=1343610 RepID=A0A9P6QJ36_9FUNG|nr:hypothetical protein DFQ27_009055 [Actinomortierella ambigua]
MATQPSERLEHLSSTESLPRHQNDSDRQNRNSNMTMIGNQNPDRLAHPLPPSPLSRSKSSERAQATPKPKQSLLHKFLYTEVGRLAQAAIFFILVSLFMAFCNQWSDHRWVKTDYTKVLLEDRGFDIFPAMRDITPANVFVMTALIFTLIGVLTICPTWTTRVIVIRRLLWVIGAISVFRALTLSVTTLPTPKEGCKPSVKTGFWDMLWVAINMIPGTIQACTDDIFSGHTTYMVTAAIQWRLYCKNRWIKWFAYVYITVGLYFVIATRLHYTVDVVLAVFITYAAWSIYMAMIDIVMDKEYFGVRRSHEKFRIFDSEWERQEKRKGIHRSALATKRAKVNHYLNRLRGPGIGYQRTEYDRVAFVPMQYNTWLTGLVRWCDGLDLRMRRADPNLNRWEELVIRHRCMYDSAENGARKADFDGSDDIEQNGEMIQIHHHEHDNSIAPVILEGVQVISPDGSTTIAQPGYGVYRKDSHNRGIGAKNERNRRAILILKVSVIVLLSFLVVLKVGQTYLKEHPRRELLWPERMEEYPGGVILTDDEGQSLGEVHATTSTPTTTTMGASVSSTPPLLSNMLRDGGSNHPMAFAPQRA